VRVPARPSSIQDLLAVTLHHKQTGVPEHSGCRRQALTSSKGLLSCGRMGARGILVVPARIAKVETIQVLIGSPHQKTTGPESPLGDRIGADRDGTADPDRRTAAAVPAQGARCRCSAQGNRRQPPQAALAGAEHGGVTGVLRDTALGAEPWARVTPALPAVAVQAACTNTPATSCAMGARVATARQACILFADALRPDT
jgi:hypothetical protein